MQDNDEIKMNSDTEEWVVVRLDDDHCVNPSEDGRYWAVTEAWAVGDPDRVPAARFKYREDAERAKPVTVNVVDLITSIAHGWSNSLTKDEREALLAVADRILRDELP